MKARAILGLAVAATVVAVLVAASNADVYGIDCYFYMAKARSLGRLEGFAANFGGVDRRFFPGYSVGLAPFHALFGEKGYIPFGLVCMAATALVAFQLGRRSGLSDEAAAWGAALGMTAPAVVQWAAQPVSEPPATLLVVFYLLQRTRAAATGRARDIVLSGLLLGLGAVTRAEAALLGALHAHDLWVVWRRGPGLRVALAAGLVAAIPPLIYVGWLMANQDPTAPSNLYLRDLSRYPVRLADIPGFFVYNLAAQYDLRFEPYAPRPTSLAVLALRALTLVSVAVGLRRIRERATPPVLPIVLLAGLHALWFYQYERFAFVWAPLTGLLVAALIDGARRQSSSPRSDAVLRAVGALCVLASAAAGATQGRAHHVDFWANEGKYDFRDLARPFTEDARCRSGVVGWSRPHFAYHVDRPFYFDQGDTDFIRAELSPGGFEVLAARTGARCIATMEEPAAWMQWAGVKPERAAAAEVVKRGPLWKIVLPP